MTEDEWVWAEEFKIRYATARMGPRRQRLFAAAVCRAVPAWAANPVARAALDTLELLADRRGTDAELSRARQALVQTRDDLLTAPVGSVESVDPRPYLALAVVNAAASDDALIDIVQEAVDFLMMGERVSRDAARRRLYGPYREIAGDPGRPAVFPRAWRTGTAVSLARRMYESRDFALMPILADALQDAGCESPDVLDHCRDPQAAHVRGCWVIDLVLGKQ